MIRAESRMTQSSAHGDSDIRMYAAVPAQPCFVDVTARRGRDTRLGQSVCPQLDGELGGLVMQT
jgi:hypothetical protein